MFWFCSCFCCYLFVHRNVALAPVDRLNWSREILKVGLGLGVCRPVLLWCRVFERRLEEVRMYIERWTSLRQNNLNSVRKASFYGDEVEGAPSTSERDRTQGADPERCGRWRKGFYVGNVILQMHVYWSQFFMDTVYTFFSAKVPGYVFQVYKFTCINLDVL